MKTLTIKDLARTEQLGRGEMAAVRGGWKMNAPSYSFGNVSYTPSYDSSITATQNLGQVQHVFNDTASGSAFLHDVDATSKVTQNGHNLIVG